jgi:hypothetical protein
MNGLDNDKNDWIIAHLIVAEKYKFLMVSSEHNYAN